MADYNIPTLEDVDETKKNMDSITEFIESTEDTLEDQYGSTRKTLKGIENQVTYAIGWNIVADFAIGVTVNNTNDVLQYNGGLYRTTETQPYTTDGATPDADTGDWVAVAEGELKTVERILNEPDGSAIYSTDYSTLLDDVEAIYDPSTQQIYNKPATVGAGERITDVTGDQLTTDAPAVYTMTLLDSISSLAQSIDDNTSDITTNAGNIDVNAGNITNNSIAITANSSAIAAISDFQSIASPVLFNADSMVLNTSSLYITNGYFAFITGVSAKGFTMSVETVSDTVDFAGSGTGTVWIARTTSNTWVFREDKPVFDVETGLYEGETEALSFITNPMVVISDVPRNFDYNISLATNTLGKTNFRNKAVSEISGSQHNNMMILINGELYTASGNSGGNPNSGTGRGLDATIRNYGVSSMTKVYFSCACQFVEATVENFNMLTKVFPLNPELKEIFNSCIQPENYQDIDINTLTNLNGMFRQSPITEFNEDISNVVNIDFMFTGSNIKSITSDLTNIVSAKSSFSACKQLKEFNQDMPKLYYGQSMFSSCKMLHTVNSNMSNLKFSVEMFRDDIYLTTANITHNSHHDYDMYKNTPIEDTLNEN